jgi:hypothetical protein
MTSYGSVGFGLYAGIFEMARSLRPNPPCRFLVTSSSFLWSKDHHQMALDAEHAGQPQSQIGVGLPNGFTFGR